MERNIRVPENVKRIAAAALITAATSAATYGLYQLGENSEKQIDDMCGGKDRKGCITTTYYTCRPGGYPMAGPTCGYDTKLVPVTPTPINSTILTEKGSSR